MKLPKIDMLKKVTTKPTVIFERMEAKEQLDELLGYTSKLEQLEKKLLTAFMKHYKNNVPIGTQKSSEQLVDEYLTIKK